MKRQIIFLALLSFIFFGCSSQQTNSKNIKIVTSNWIGYTPLIYAYENGDLKKFGIELIITTSLQSSTLLYEKNKFDGLCSTQHEIQTINAKKNTDIELIPIALFNRSYGGDKILSSIPSEELHKKEYQTLDIFLEAGSVNEILFEYLKKHYQFTTNYKRYNTSQHNIAQMTIEQNSTTPHFIISYEPYASKLLQKGYTLIDSTKNDKILVFDFLSIRKNAMRDSEIKQLQKTINDSIKVLQNKPKKFYKKIKYYFEDVSYDEFMAKCSGIQLYEKSSKKDLLGLIKQNNIVESTKYIQGAL